jgi:hypothetical protein
MHFTALIALCLIIGFQGAAPLPRIRHILVEGNIHVPSESILRQISILAGAPYDGGASQSNLLLDLAATHFLGSPFTLALAGVNRLTDLNVASLLPNQKDLIGVFRRREIGAGLSGSYPLTTKAQLGLGFMMKRESIAQEIGGFNPGRQYRVSNRSDLSSIFYYDSARGAGQIPCGYSMALGQAWSGDIFLRTVDSTRAWATWGQFHADPLTRGRNALAFRLQGMGTLPLGSNSLALERRLFPGDELVRGFRRGELTPWSYTSASVSPGLQPAGADTALGFSAEYRIPLSGPWSGAAFLDLGWTGLGSTSTAADEKIVGQTNRLIRMSMGAELRYHVPGLRQPARIIFAWNPLRLDNLIQGIAPQKLADPLKSVHLALGNVF